MRNVVDATFSELGVRDNRKKFPDELRGVGGFRKFVGTLEAFAAKAQEEVDQLRDRLIDGQAKNGELRDENAKLRDRMAKVEAELVQHKLRQRLEQMELKADDRKLVLECVR